MCRTRIPIVAALLFVVPPLATCYAQSPSELPAVDQVKKQIESIRPAIVQFSYDGFGSGQLHFGCGVIVSSDGHVAVCGPVGAVLDDRLLELITTDGRKLRGRALGWSSEYGVGMLKIDEPGQWKFVKLSDKVIAGETCLALGYPQNRGSEDDNIPGIRLGLVTTVCKGQWFLTSYQSDFGSHPVFNLHGELLGLQVSSDGTYSTFSDMSQIRNHWQDLASGLNMDRKRLFEQTKPPVSFAELPTKMTADALERAKAATVKIGEAGKKPYFSGVIVPGGYVLTCAHHGRLPGDQLEITLADGRTANAVVKCPNRITDTCLLKISGIGEWPCVELGYSNIVPAGTSVVMIGYPTNNNGIATVLEASVVDTPQGGLKRRDSFSDTLFLECNDEEAVTNLNGASGGVIFDTAGNVIGVMDSTDASWSHDGVFHGEVWNARVELIHNNWEELTADSAVETVDNEEATRKQSDLAKLASEL